MHKYLLLLLLFVACGKAKVYDRSHYQSYPSFDQITEFFYTEYNSKYTVKFEKKQEGWYWVEQDPKSENQVKSRALLWSAEKKAYVDSLKWKQFSEKNAATLNPAIDRQKQVYGSHFYDKCPFFGYENENQDILALLEGEKNLTAEEMECLARAHSRTASQRLMPSETDKKFHAYDTSFNPKAYKQEELDFILDHARKSLIAYSELKLRFPEYETLVGSAATKWSNEFLTHWYELGIVQQDQLQSEFLPDNLYNEAILACAKNMLESCPQNGILFTWGDNDTFPLLYAQAKLGTRPDVLIVNSSLANLGRYIYYLTNIIKEDKRLKTQLPIEKYKLNANNFLLIQAESRPVFFGAYLRDLAKNPDRYINQSYTNMDKVVFVCPTNRFQLIEDTATVEVTIEQPYLLKSEIFILDVIASNMASRPICFSMGFPQNKLDQLFGGYLYKRGMVYQLQTRRHGGFGLGMDEAATAQLLQKFQYPTLPAKLYQHKENEMTAMYSIYTTYQLCESYWAADKTAEVAALLTNLEQKYPLATTPYGQFYLAIGAYWHKLQQPENADKYWNSYENYINTLWDEHSKKEYNTPFAKLREQENTALFFQNYLKTLESLAAPPERIEKARKLLK